ncbi:MAG: efflux RND transporter permease subunit, partial [Victivallaceae bacterium]
DVPKKNFFFFRWFDAFFGKISGAFSVVVNSLIRKSVFIFILYMVMIFISVKIYGLLPTGFIPEEDQGAFFINVQLPDGAALPRTQRVADKVTEMAKNTPGVSDVIVNAGYSILSGTSSSNNAMIIVILDDWSKRKTPALQQSAILEKLRGQLYQIPEAMVMPFTVPAIPGLGSTGGFSFVIEDTTGTHPQRLVDASNALIVAANQDPAMTGVFSTFRASVPQVYLKVDREKALKMGVQIQDINDAFQSLLGYSYVNDFNKFGKVYKVEIQAQTQFRSDIAGLSSIKLRNKAGEMVPLNTLVEIETTFGPQFLNRYNMYSSLTVNGSAAPGHSSGQAMKAMEKLADKTLPSGMKYEWTDMSYQEKLAGGKVVVVFILALVFIYLFLVAQYESWMIPLAVMLSVPIAFVGALGALFARGIDNNIYTQVGFVLLFGLAAKTAILIVEFAKELCDKDENLSAADAAIHAAKLRFRAVVMTAISFVLGVLPLVTASGAGALSRKALGTTVFGGMAISCVFGTVLIPSFFVVIMLMVNFKKRKKAALTTSK